MCVCLSLQQYKAKIEKQREKMWKHHKENTEAFFEYFIYRARFTAQASLVPQ